MDAALRMICRAQQMPLLSGPEVWLVQARLGLAEYAEQRSVVAERPWPARIDPEEMPELLLVHAWPALVPLWLKRLRPAPRTGPYDDRMPALCRWLGV